MDVLELRKWKRREEDEYWKVEDKKLSQIKKPESFALKISAFFLLQKL